MKTVKKIILLIGLFACANTWSQEQQTENNNVIKEVDKVNKASDEISQTASQTTDAVKSTVANTKEALNEVGSLFGSGKNKAEKSKGNVVINIQQIDYDNEYLTQLYNHIEKQKGVKKPAKTYSNGLASISVTYKESADALWQTVPKQVRKAFKLIQMNNQSISLQLGTAQIEN